MPPDIIAGLVALAGPLPPAGPPGAAGTGMPAAPLGSVSATLFASLLTQSSPPNLQLAARKPDAPPIVKLGSAAKQQISKSLKTMDTLPTLSFPRAGTAIQASELLPSSPARHKAADTKTAVDDKTATDASSKVVNLTDAAASGLNTAPTVAPAPVIISVVAPVQAALLPVLTLAAAPAPRLPHVSEIAASSVSSMAAPAAASAVPKAFASTQLSPAKVSLPTLPAPETLPAPNAPLTPASSIQPQSELLAASAPVAAPASVPPAFSLLLQSPQMSSQAPQAPTLQVPAGVPLMAGQVAAQENPIPIASVLVASAPAASRIAVGLPQALPYNLVPGRVTLGPVASLRPLKPAQAALLLPPSTPIQAAPNAASTAAPGAFVLPATAAPPVVVPAPLGSGPAKQPGKSAQTALKSPPANADTYTRIADVGRDAKPEPTNALAPTVKAPLPVKLPEPDFGSQSSVPEKTNGAKAEAKAPVGILESGTPEAVTLSAAQAAPPAPGLTSRLLPLADQIKIVHQVADGVAAMPLPVKPGGVQQMSLQLHPKDWGSLHVSVSVAPAQTIGAAKTVTAHIVAETPQVKAALQSQTGALHQALRASGLNLEHLTVSVKPAPEAIKTAAQSASAGFSGGQGQPDAGSNQAPFVHTAADSQFLGAQFGTSAGSSQNSRQEQPPASTFTSAQAEAEDIAPVQLPIRPSGRIDTHA